MPEEPIGMTRDGKPIYAGQAQVEAPIPTSAGQEPVGMRRDGTPIYLGAGLSPTGDLSKPVPQGDIPKEFIDSIPKFVGRTLPEALPALGGAAGAAVGGPFAPLTSAIGAGAGSLLKQGARSLLPGLLGEPSDSSGGDALLDAVLQVVPGMAKQGFKSTLADIVGNSPLKRLPGVKSGVANEMGEKLSKLRMPEVDIIETAADNSRNAYLTLGPQVADNPLAQMLNKIPYSQGKNLSQQSIKETSDYIMGDVSRVRDLKLLTGEAGTANQLGIHHAIEKGLAEGTRLNPAKILAELNGAKADVYREAILPKSMESITGLLREMQSQQLGKGEQYIANFTKGHLLFKVPAALAAGTLGTTGAALATVYLPVAALSSFASNPSNARLLIQAMRTGTSAKEADFVTKALSESMRGLIAIARTPDGKEKRVTIGQDEEAAPTNVSPQLFNRP